MNLVITGGAGFLGQQLIRALLTREGATLNPVLGSTARLLLAHSALFAAGIAAAR